MFLWNDSFFHSKSENIVETEPIELIARDIKKKYNDDPLGWNILSDHKGNVLILGSREGYKVCLSSTMLSLGCPFWISLARSLGVSLIGFARGRDMNVYSGE